MRGRFKLSAVLAWLAFSPSPVAFAQNVDMGRTYHDLDAQIISITTVFDSGERAKTTREQNGFSTELTDGAGVTLATLRRRDDLKRFEFSRPDRAGRRNVALRPDVLLGSDWDAHQVWRLWKDATTPGGGRSRR